MTNEIDRRLNAAKLGDPSCQSTEGLWFAWKPVLAWDYEAQERKPIWLEWVTWFRPLGICYEYATVRGHKEWLARMNASLDRLKKICDAYGAVLQARRLFGPDTPEHIAACRIFDVASQRSHEL